MIHLYHEYSRSIRVGDLDAYINCLPKIANYFFALNHPNYSRWTVKYHDNLLRMPETHPQVYAEFKKGGFSIKRTKKSFSGSPIDLTLEQTINADSACSSASSGFPSSRHTAARTMRHSPVGSSRSIPPSARFLAICNE